MCNSSRYHKAFSPGIQEYIEAVALMQYLETGALLTIENLQCTLLITNEDYLAGIADL